MKLRSFLVVLATTAISIALGLRFLTNLTPMPRIAVGIGLSIAAGLFIILAEEVIRWRKLTKTKEEGTK